MEISVGLIISILFWIGTVVYSTFYSFMRRKNSFMFFGYYTVWVTYIIYSSKINMEGSITIPTEQQIPILLFGIFLSVLFVIMLFLFRKLDQEDSTKETA